MGRAQVRRRRGGQQNSHVCGPEYGHHYGPNFLPEAERHRAHRTLIALAQTRRNATLREIERRQQTLGQKLWRVTQHLEDDQTRLIESAPIDGTNAK